MQNGLELYYNKNGAYPSANNWADMTTGLTGAAIGVQQIPNDPSSGKTYYYQSYSSDSAYVIGAKLESVSNSVFTGYSPPSLGVPSGMTDCTSASKEYCLSL